MRSLAGVLAVVLAGCDLVFPLRAPAVADAGDVDAGDAGESKIHILQRHAQNLPNTAVCSVTMSQPALAGSLLVLTVTHPAGIDLQMVGDDVGNAFLPVIRRTWGTLTTEMYYAKNVLAGSFIVNAPLSPNAAFCLAYIDEYSGADPDDPLDQMSAMNGSVAGLASSGTVTTTTPSELLFGHGEGQNLIMSVGTGFMERGSEEFNLEEDRTVTQIGDYEATFIATGSTTPSDWVAIVATFR